MRTIHSRTRVAELIGDKIIRQQLPAGRSVGEVALANELGVSRTPVREALLGLQSDGLVSAQRGRGFVVQPLSAAEARQIYPIIGALERLALASSAPASADLRAQLASLNRQIAEADSPPERMKLDAAWHRTIVSGCKNPRLVSVIAGMKQSSLRYEYAYQRVSQLRAISIPEHEQIAELMTTDPARAGEAIEAHWLRGMAAVLRMMEGVE
jgi:DNA-binding GntR family transcriptional regulator